MRLSPDVIARPKSAAVLIAVAGLLALPFSLFIDTPYAVVYPLALIVGVIIGWLLIESKPRRSLCSPFISKSNLKIFITGWLISACFVILLFHQNVNDGPVLVATLILMVFTALISLYGGSFPLLFILGGALIHRVPMFYDSQLLLGSDTYYHEHAVQAVHQLGTISALSYSKYLSTPIFHVNTSASSFLIGLPVHDSLFWAMTVSYVIMMALVAFSITTTLTEGSLAAPVASFLVVISDAVLGWSVMPQPITLTMALAAVFIFIVLKYFYSSSRKWRFLAVVIPAALIFTQHFASIVLVLVGTIFLLSVPVITGQRSDLRSLSLFAIIWALALGHWTYTNFVGADGGVPVIIVVVSQYFLSPSEPPVPVPGAVDLASPARDVALIDVIGGSILLGLGIVGIIFALNKDHKKFRGTIFGLAATLGTVYGVILVAPAAGLSQLFPMRWFQLSYVLLAPFAAIGITELYSRMFADRRAAISLLIFLLISAMILMAITPIGRVNDPLSDSSPGAERYGMNDKEVEMLEFATERAAERPIWTDSRAATVSTRHYQLPGGTIVVEYETGLPVYEGESVLVLERPYMYTKQAKFNIALSDRSVLSDGPVPEIAVECAQNIVYSGESGYNVRETSRACN